MSDDQSICSIKVLGVNKNRNLFDESPPESLAKTRKSSLTTDKGSKRAKLEKIGPTQEFCILENMTIDVPIPYSTRRHSAKVTFTSLFHK
jgi:hypothetical protein